jgi:acyl carrier protein
MDANMTAKVTEKVTSVLVEQLGVDWNEVVPTASFSGDLGADSLDCIEVAMALENEFGIELPDEQVYSFEGTDKTVADLIALVEQHLQSKTRH